MSVLSGTDHRAWMDDERALVTAEEVLIEMHRKK